VLFNIGIAAWLAYSGDAGNIGHDAVFYYASHRCALLLSERSDNSTPSYLRLMQPICGRDGDERQYYDKLIENQKKHQQQTKLQ
jgi:hypothetical protein